uniref:G-patch domain-containing protein n=1 Tax=Megaselia scalaris TaxID=36166 RepID=T1GBV4_MEGSC
MMQKLGWTGGGLGSNKDGMREPISLDFGQTTRHGLGAKSTLDEGDMDKLNFEYCRQLFKNYCASEEIRDLKFTSAFSKNQRASLHGIVGKLPSLKSVSRGKDENRYLVVSKIISPKRIAEEILLNNNELYKNKFNIKVPMPLKEMFPKYFNAIE